MTAADLPAPGPSLPIGGARPAAAAGTREAKRSWWWVVHHLLGLKVSLLMSVILLTGTVAVLANEIDWLIFPAMRVQPQAGPHASWGTWAAAVREAEPNADIVYIARPLDPWFAARAMVVRDTGETRFVEINPWTAQVQGTTPWINAKRVLRELHRHLMLPQQVGIPLVGSFGVILLLSLVTGLIAYKKFWRGFLHWPKWRRGRSGELRRYTGDLHRFVGLWALWLVLLMGVTGTWYLVEELGAEAPRLPAPVVATRGWDVQNHSEDRAIAVALRAQPDLRIHSLQYPWEGDPGVVIDGQAQAILVRERTNAVYIDPDSLKVLMSTRGERLGIHQRISEMADPLHFGTWGGITTKVIWFLFGLLTTALSVTGVMIYSTRLKKAEAEREPRKRRGPLLRAWDGMGPFAYVGVAILILAACFTPQAIAG